VLDAHCFIVVAHVQPGPVEDGTWHFIWYEFINNIASADVMYKTDLIHILPEYVIMIYIDFLFVYGIN